MRLVQDLKSAQMLEPNNTAVITELESLQNEMASSKKQEQQERKNKVTAKMQVYI